MGSAGEITTVLKPELQEGIGYWAKRWAEKKTGFHMNEVNPNLLKYLDDLTKFKDPAGPKKILVPLCGQTQDLLYLMSLGHEVFGIEAVAECIEALVQRDNFQFKFDKENSIYHTEDRKLQIYFGDIFKCPIEKWGPFDCIWDRGSLIAIEYPERKSYAEFLKRSVSAPNSEAGECDHDFRYLLEAVVYDKSAWTGPPRSVSKDDLEELYPWASATVLDVAPLADSNGLRKVVPNEIQVQEINYMLSNK